MPDNATQKWLFLGFFIAFAIKAPLVPFHTWLPDAGAEAPAGGAALLVGVLDKVGTFGFLRYCLPLFPDASRYFAPTILILSVIGILYAAFLAIGQRDMKRLVAYTSVAHFGFIGLGIFAFTTQGGTGAVLYMVNHGLSTGALFMVVGLLIARGKSRNVDDYGGAAKVTPILAGLFLLAGLSALALPGMSTFVSEFLVLVGTFTRHKGLAVLATTGIVLAAIYVLYLYQRTFQGTVSEKVVKFRDLNVREVFAVAPLIALIVVLGVYPKPVLDVINPAVNATLHDVHQTDPTRPLRRTFLPEAIRSERTCVLAAAPSTPIHAPSVVLPRPVADLHRARRRAGRRARRGCRPAGRALRRAGRRHARRARRARLSRCCCCTAPRGRPPSPGHWPSTAPALFVQGSILAARHHVRAAGRRAQRRREQRDRRLGGRGRRVARRTASWPSTERVQTEVFPLMLFAVSGMLIFPIANNLLLMFVALEVLSLPLYLMAGHGPAPPAAVPGSGAQVLPARRLRLGVLPLRAGAAVRLCQLRRPRRDPARRRRTSDQVRRAALYGARPAARRAAVQGRHRAVPQLDPGRLPRRADAGHRVHGLVHEGRRLRRDPAGALRRVQHLCAGTGDRSSGRWPSRRCSSARSSG